MNNIKKVLVANRGEIAVRCIKACKDLGVKSVSIYTEADAASLHTILGDKAVLLPGSDGSAYTDGNAILQICQRHGVDAVLPGYGFLSENAEFASAAEAAGIIFVGPSVASIKAMGLKHEAREIADRACVPTIPGTSLLSSASDAVEGARNLGFPVMLKATGGGGGMGLQICETEAEIKNAFDLVESRAGTLFKNNGVFLEKYYPRSRHIEVQVAGNGEIVVAFGERECSLQRRHQKVIEECPSPFVERHKGLRQKLLHSAITYASQLKYKSVGTVEFLVDDETADYFFLEMNTRLQVEHGITELCYRVDLVQLMLQQADYEKGGKLGIPTANLESLVSSEPYGSAIESRVYAEDALRNFAPSPGLLQHVQWPVGDQVRVDTWVKSGQNITPYYDPLIAKIIVHSPDGRAAAQTKMVEALNETVLQGTETNIEYLAQVIKSDAFTQGNTLTNFLATFTFDMSAVQVLSPGVLTTIQDYPGRIATGHGVPTSGPIDDVSSRIANFLVGNKPEVEVLEITMAGPELLFHVSAVIAVCGAPTPVLLDGIAQPMWARLVINKGQKLRIGNVGDQGFRAYVAFKGGFPKVPNFLGSKSTAPELGFGGVQGRKLQTHDVLALSPDSSSWAASATPLSIPADALLSLDVTYLYCMEGPYGSDEILNPEGRQVLYESAWQVSHNSGRSGVRLSGPQLKWSRETGGGGGSHPSNVLDYGYPTGGINWTGDFPIIFSRDSPDLGGFACPATVCSAELWKVGQLKPGDELRFRPITFDAALQLAKKKEAYLNTIQDYCLGNKPSISTLCSSQDEQPKQVSSSLLWEKPATAKTPAVFFRQGGDTSIIAQYGEQSSDLRNTICVRIVSKKLEALNLKSVTATPSIITLTVHFDPLQISRDELIKMLQELDGTIGDLTNISIPAREVQLPVCLDHPEIEVAIQRYMDNIRPTATYLPDNVEYLRKNNALTSRRDVFDSLLKTSWLTVAVGFYVGTPFMFPLDPKYVYVGQKYNPSRIYTPGGSLGLGGSLLGLYPVASPGGYQLMGRTLGAWDSTGTRPGFSLSKPWLFNHFDLVKFVEVSEQEYDQLERDYTAGRYTFNISEISLNMDQFIAKFDAANQDPEHHEWKTRQQAAITELAKVEATLFQEWTTAKALEGGSNEQNDKFLESPDTVTFNSPVSASVWKINVKTGDILKKGQTVATLEAMKMEIKVVCGDDQEGTIVKRILSPPGRIVAPGTAIVAGLKAN